MDSGPCSTVAGHQALTLILAGKGVLRASEATRNMLGTVTKS